MLLDCTHSRPHKPEFTEGDSKSDENTREDKLGGGTGRGWGGVSPRKLWTLLQGFAIILKIGLDTVQPNSKKLFFDFY